MRALAIAALLVLCAVVSAESELAGIETVEPVFVEEAGAVEATVEGFPHVLSKKMEKTTVEPRYYGESKKLKQYVTPEYAVPKPIDPRKIPKHPRVFTSHYFSPLPKKLAGKKVKASKDKKGRKYIPFRATVPTPLGERMAKKGFTEAELRYGRLPNKFDDPKDRMKNTMAPAPTPSLVELSAEESVEVDTTEQMEAEEVNSPPFSMEGMDGHMPVMINGPEEFYQSGWSAPTWTDEEASVEETNADAHTDSSAEEESYEDMEAEVALIEAVAAEHDEEESEDEEADEAEEEEESEDSEEADEESEDESEEESDEESDSEDEVTEVSLIEEADVSEDEIEDEMAVNEAAVAQVDMDATSDEAGIVETAQESAEEDAAEEAEMEANEEAAQLLEEDGLLESADNLLVEVDAHLAENEDTEEAADTDSETEAESDSEKGTPGSTIAAGMTWEEAQNARLDAIESQIAAEKASTPKVAAKVVSSTADLAKTEANEQEPEYESENAAATETTTPELVDAVPTAQQVLLEKIAKLKAIRRNN